MIIALAVSAAAVAGIIGLALALPCAACEKRRQRMREAYEKWRERNKA